MDDTVDRTDAGTPSGERPGTDGLVPDFHPARDRGERTDAFARPDRTAVHPGARDHRRPATIGSSASPDAIGIGASGQRHGRAATIPGHHAGPRTVR